MKKTVCELFAGVGGFRCGLNNIKTAEDYDKKEKWDTVWFNQWEPAEKTTQYAHDCWRFSMSGLFSSIFVSYIKRTRREKRCFMVVNP